MEKRANSAVTTDNLRRVNQIASNSSILEAYRSQILKPVCTEQCLHARYQSTCTCTGRRCTPSKRFLSLSECGLHTWQQYSRWGLSRQRNNSFLWFIRNPSPENFL